MRSRTLVALALVTAALLPAGRQTVAASPGAPPMAPAAFVRVDQAGYGTRESKTAFLLASTAAANAPFAVVDTSGRIILRGHAGPGRGRWNERFPHVYPLHFTALRASGSYRVQVNGAVSAISPRFRVGSRVDLLRPLVAAGATFFRNQRDGADVVAGQLHRRPSHRNDAAATIYAWPHFASRDSDVIAQTDLKPVGGPIDVEGGWFDAGDFVKFTHTTAYADDMLLVAQRSMGSAAPHVLAREARFGLAWLAKAWDPANNRMVIQVGIGSGNRAGTFLGDHDLWRLPQRDDGLRGKDKRYLRHRPAFVANAAAGRLAPNLAGRVSAAFALAAQTDSQTHPARAQHEMSVAIDIYGRARTHDVTPANVVTALPHSFYPESSWRDDLELGAAELARAARRLHQPAGSWIAAAEHWAAAYHAHDAGADTLNLYDVSALADAELLSLTDDATARQDLRSQLARARTRGEHDVFAAGASYREFDVASHLFGLVASAELFRSRTGRDGYESFQERQRGWAFGANPWGVSLMIGAGSTFPKCPQHVVANLSGSQDGRPPVLRGAVVNGPNDQSLFAGGLGSFFGNAQRCPPDRTDRYAVFTGHHSRFVDDVRAWQTVEPAIDFTATAVLALALG